MGGLGADLGGLGADLGGLRGGLGRSWAILGRSWGVLGPLLGCPWPLFGDLGAAGGDFESIWDRLGVDLEWMLDGFGLICYLFLIFFPVRALAQGSLCVRFPSYRGWSSKDSADFRSTKIGVRTPSLEKISQKITKTVLKKIAFHDRISIAGVVWLKNANQSKIGLQ